MKVPDLNSVVKSLEHKIPNQLTEISGKLEEIPKVKEAIESISTMAVNEVQKVQKFTDDIISTKWKVIKRDIYKMIFFLGVGIFFLAGLITVEVIFIVRLFS
ncbi:MAG: hypothetical protein ACK4IX_02720 [Candidatus Sericytochromatia bacterium]